MDRMAVAHPLTPAIITIHGLTFSLAGVRSYRVEAVRPGFEDVLEMATVLVVVVMIGTLIAFAQPSSPIAVAGGLACLGIAAAAGRTLWDKARHMNTRVFHLIFSTAGGDVTVVTSPDQVYMRHLVAELDAAHLGCTPRRGVAQPMQVS